MPIPKHQWRTPSQAQQKDCFGNENQTRFSLTARLDDGFVVWRGWFDDRDDADEFLWALVRGTLPYERELWRLPTPWWEPFEGVTYQFLTNVFIVSTSASNQTDSVPADWNNSSNNVDVIACGASGGWCSKSAVSNQAASGGGGGAWSRQTNVSLTPSGSATFFLNVGGAAITFSSNTGGNSNGNNGPDAWYNGTTLAGSSVGAKGGVGGNGPTAANTAATSSAGGAAASGVGGSKNSGGASGTASATGGNGASGGGGAAGPNGNGNPSPNATPASTAGGSGDAGSGGAAGTAGNITTSGGTGGNGAEYDATHGSGGGGGGTHTSQPSTFAGSGGNYGAGGGGDAPSSGGASGLKTGAGIQGLIVKQYTPVLRGAFPNLAMIGF